MTTNLRIAGLLVVRVGGRIDLQFVHVANLNFGAVRVLVLTAGSPVQSSRENEFAQGLRKLDRVRLIPELPVILV